MKPKDQWQMQQQIHELLGGDLDEDARLAILREIAADDSARLALREALELRQDSLRAFGLDLAEERLRQEMPRLKIPAESMSGTGRHGQRFVKYAAAASVLIAVAAVWFVATRGHQAQTPIVRAPESEPAAASAPSASQWRIPSEARLTGADVQRVRQAWAGESASQHREVSWLAMGSEGSRSGFVSEADQQPAGNVHTRQAVGSVVAVRCLLADTEGNAIDRRDLVLRRGEHAEDRFDPAVGLGGQLEVHDRPGHPLMILLMIQGDQEVGWGMQGQVEVGGDEPTEIGSLRLKGRVVRLIVQAKGVSLSETEK